MGNILDAFKENHDKKTIDTSKKLRVGIIGTGWIAGAHVLLEKPMCVTLDEAVEICKAEKESGCILSIGFQPRFNPNMMMVKNIVKSGILGDIYYIQTGGGRRRGIPVPFGTTFIEKETGGIGAFGDYGRCKKIRQGFHHRPEQAHEQGLCPYEKVC